MSILFWIIVAVFLGSITTVVLASFVLLFSHGWNRTVVPLLVSYATGTLLGAAFLGMIPKAFSMTSLRSMSATVLTGILLFFLLERSVIWRHCHDDNCEIHTSAGTLILFGDAFHNFVDGIVIAAAFMTDISFGIATTIAVFSHEVPQELGDFAILLESGYTKQKAFLYNLFSQLFAVLGAIIAYFSLGLMQRAVPYVLAISAASFIYISLADLIPGLHRNPALKVGLGQFALILLGIFTIAVFAFSHG